MKFSIQRNLLAQYLGRLSGVVEKTDSLSDFKRYIILKVADGKIVSTVYGDDVLATVTMDVDKLGDPDLCKIESDGIYAVNGKDLLATVTKTNIDSRVLVEHEDIKDDSFEKPLQETDDKKLAASGALKVVMDGLGGNTESFWLQCLSIPLPQSLDFDRSDAVTVEASEFCSLIEKTGVTAGKASQNLDRSHVMIRTKPTNKLEMATYDGQRFGWAVMDAQFQKELYAIAPHSSCLAVTKTMDADHPAFLLGNKKALIVLQDIWYGTKEIGNFICRFASLSETFINFEPYIRNLDFKYSCKVKKSDLDLICSRLAIFEIVKTKCTFDPDNSRIVFEKIDANKRVDNMVLPISDPKGEKLELFISSRFVKEGSDKCENREVEIKFSGRTSLVLMNISKNFKVFFNPFARGE